MDFMPQANWQWIYKKSQKKERSELRVQMGEQFIDIAFKENMLISFCESIIPFTVEDVANYSLLFEKLSSAYDSPLFTCQTVLHILAFELYHKPIMPKTWLFQSTEIMVSSPEKGNVFLLESKELNEAENYLVLENSEKFVICMLLAKYHQLSPRKVLNQFQIIKVTADKLSTVRNESESDWNSYQIA